MADPGRIREITAADGTLLRCRVWEAERPRAVVLVVHGLGEHSGRYAGLAGELDVRGISVFAPDLRGHGLSSGHRGHVRRFETYLSDLDRVFEKVRDLRGGTQVVLFGHSMGGLVVLRYAETRTDVRLRGLALSAPQLALARPPPPWLRRTAELLAMAFPTLPLSNRIDPADLSHDPAEVEAYRSDPLVHDRVTLRLFQEMGRAMDAAMQEIPAVAVPAAFIMIPGADRVVAPEATRTLASRLANTVSTKVQEYPSMYHEPLHEVDRARAIADLVAWVDSRIT